MAKIAGRAPAPHIGGNRLVGLVKFGRQAACDEVRRSCKADRPPPMIATGKTVVSIHTRSFACLWVNFRLQLVPVSYGAPRQQFSVRKLMSAFMVS